MENRRSLRNKVHVSRLYPEILVLIFEYLDVREKGRAARVCRAWRDAAYQKSVWRGIEAKLHLRRSNNPGLFQSLVRRGIRKVQILSMRRSVREVVEGIPNLQSLNLTGCYNLSDYWLIFSFMDDFPSLTELNLSMCKQIGDCSLKNITCRVKNLEVLDLGGCSNITNVGLAFIAQGLVKLRCLNLRSCRNIADTGIGFLGGVDQWDNSYEGLLNLENLSLQDCQKVTDEGLRHVSERFKKLLILNLSFCANISDSGLKYLARMPSLQDLNLRSCDNITDLGLLFLAEGNSQLFILDVSFCERVGDQGLQYISQGLFNLRCLSLNACPITDEGIAKIARTLADLQTLDIGQCIRITDKSLALIAEHMKRLWMIDIYGCVNISPPGLKILMTLPNLSVLNLGLWRKR